MISFSAFVDEMEKIAGAGHAAVDLAGLGMLAVPSVQKARGNREKAERGAHKWEIAGLGTLAGGVAHEHRHDFMNAAKSGWGKIRGAAPAALAHA